MKKNIKYIGIALLVILVVGVLYYINLPAINIHAQGFWTFIIFMFVIITAVSLVLSTVKSHVDIRGFFEQGDQIFGKHRKNADHNSKLEFMSKTAGIATKAFIGITIALILVFIVGSVLSSELINAKAYEKLLDIETRSFTNDVKEVSYSEIPILDKDSATTIGKRVMGTMVDMVSQYEVDSSNYTQINYKGKPVRVAPLKYGNAIKWFTNNNTGIPAYIMIDMTNQEAQCIRLSEGIKYSTSDHFDRNIYRHLRFAYPTYIFDDINFEIDETGTPYWICPVKQYNIGLFGGVTIGKVVLCNAITGEMQCYDVADVPNWVDTVYSAELLIRLYNYNGTLKNGYFNSILSQKGCLRTTDGYNYIALDDDVWVYTGITSVGQDESNVGFVLMNKRTAETRYYEIAGAEENSAMSSAEGKVQHLGYSATFPLLLNIGGQPTYFMALKDSAGLVKQYAMLNIEKYQTVATADTVAECEKVYRQMMNDNGISTTDNKEDTKVQTKTITGNITKIVDTVINGNSHYYIMLDSSKDIFDVNVADNIDIIRYNIQDEITLEYTIGDSSNTVVSLKSKK